MQTRTILSAALLAMLAGCQPEASKPGQATEPVTATPVQDELPAEKQAATVSGVEMKKAATPVAVKPDETAPVAIPTPVVQAKPEAKVGAGVLSQADALALAKKGNCLACHTLDKKSVGPAWRDVAVKYRSDAGAEARLTEKIAKGGKGVWGNVAMPANPQVNEKDRLKLVQFILSLK